MELCLAECYQGTHADVSGSEKFGKTAGQLRHCQSDQCQRGHIVHFGRWGMFYVFGLQGCVLNLNHRLKWSLWLKSLLAQALIPKTTDQTFVSKVIKSHGNHARRGCKSARVFSFMEAFFPGNVFMAGLSRARWEAGNFSTWATKATTGMSWNGWGAVKFGIKQLGFKTRCMMGSPEYIDALANSLALTTIP